MTTERASNGTRPGELATCHGIIGHPQKAKFLAIRHSDGWLPPTVMFPPGAIHSRAELINQGIAKKYGLQTKLLRPLVSAGAYHCVELELHGRPERRLDAVWVGREEYERFQAPRDGQPDPFEWWLDEQERGESHRLRPAWERPGWFDRASHWIHFQLDRLQIQPTGSVEQYGFDWGEACVLRIPTGEGPIHLKAGGGRPPSEARITSALAVRWPDRIATPLAVHEERNWMLYRDLSEQGKKPWAPEDIIPFAATLADLQVESASETSRWQELGCPVHGLDYLRGFIREPERLTPWLRAGGGRLTDDEIERLVAALEAQLGLVDSLSGYGLPDTLLHAGFRETNLLQRESGPLLLDWSATAIGHPFFALEHLLRLRGASAVASRVPRAPLREAALSELLAAYLQPFTRHATMDRLQQAMELTERLLTLWTFTRVAERLEWAEPGSLHFQELAVWFQRGARRLIREQPTGAVLEV